MKSACMADRPEMFGPTRGFSGVPIQWNHVHNVVGLTLVAMGTKLGLGAEIKSPTGLSVCLSVCLPVRLEHPEHCENSER